MEEKNQLGMTGLNRFPSLAMFQHSLFITGDYKTGGNSQTLKIIPRPFLSEGTEERNAAHPRCFLLHDGRVRQSDGEATSQLTQQPLISAGE